MRKTSSIVLIVSTSLGILLSARPLAFGSGFYNIGVFLKTNAATNNIKFQQQTTIGTAGTQSLALPSITVGSGNMLVLVIGGRVGGTSPTISDTNLGTSSWVHVTGFPYSSTSVAYIDIWYSLNHPSGATSVTATYGQALYAGANLSEWSGALTASAEETQNHNGTTTVTGQSGTITTANAFDLLIGGCATSVDDTWTNQTDYGSSGGSVTMLTSALSGGSSGSHQGSLQAAYQLVSATGTYGFQMTSTNATNQCGIAAFKSQ